MCESTKASFSFPPTIYSENYQTHRRAEKLHRENPHRQRPVPDRTVGCVCSASRPSADLLGRPQPFSLLTHFSVTADVTADVTALRKHAIDQSSVSVRRRRVKCTESAVNVQISNASQGGFLQTHLSAYPDTCQGAGHSCSPGKFSRSPRREQPPSPTAEAAAALTSSPSSVLPSPEVYVNGP